MNVLVSSLEQCMSVKEYTKVWNCPACDSENRLSQTRMIQKVLALPSFIKVVPEPPQRKDGLTDRKTYHKIFSRWFWQFLDELEAQAANFRDDNWQKDGQSENEDVDTAGDEID